LDIVGEFVNIISGNALSKLSSKGKNFEPEPPISYDSKSSPYKIKENSNIVIIPLLMPEGKSQICLEFY
jgi:CheY-specific phosphatase CheX